MILVDTNVVSEPLRSAAEPRVAEWLDAQALETLYLSAITVAELRFGVRSLPAGHRRNRLHEDLEGQVLPHVCRAGPALRSCSLAGLCGADGRSTIRRANDPGLRRLHCGDRRGQRHDGGDAGHRAVRGGGTKDCRSVDAVENYRRTVWRHGYKAHTRIDRRFRLIRCRDVTAVSRYDGRPPVQKTPRSHEHRGRGTLICPGSGPPPLREISPIGLLRKLAYLIVRVRVTI